jgi:restriction endonuclease S subunit
MKAIEVRGSWVETTLDGIAEYINGYPFKPADLGEVGLPVIRIKQLLDPNEPVDRTETDTPERCHLRDGDIVFSWSGTLAVRIWNRGPATLNQHLFRVVEKKGIFKGIVPLILDHAIKELEEKSHGTTMKHITKQTLLPHKVLLPPLPEQKRIVDLISSIDSYIEVLQQQLESAKKSRNAVLHELLNTGGDDWIASSLGIQMSLEYGKPLTESNRDGVGFPVYGSAGIVGMHSKPLVTTAPVIVVGRKGTAGAVYWSEDQCFIIDTAYFVEAKTDIELKFLFHLLNFLDLKSVTAQTGVPGLNRDRAYSIKCKIPPKAKQIEIVGIISTMDEVVNKTELTLADARNLRSGLLSDLLSGEHEIPASYDKVMGAA